MAVKTNIQKWMGIQCILPFSTLILLIGYTLIISELYLIGSIFAAIGFISQLYLSIKQRFISKTIWKGDKLD